MLFNGRNDAIKFLDNYSSMIFETKRKVTEGEPELKSSKAKTKTAEKEPKPKLSKAKTKLEKFSLEFCEEFINEIKFDEAVSMSKYLKSIFHPLFLTPLFLAKELYDSNQNMNDEIVKHINDALTELKKIIII